MERAIVFVAEASMLEGVFVCLCGVACVSEYKGHELALSDKAAVEEGGK